MALNDKAGSTGAGLGLREPAAGLAAGSGIRLSRRAFVIGAPLALAACQTTVGLPGQPALPDETFDYAAAYGPMEDDGFKLPAINYTAFDRKFWRQVVDYDTSERAGTIVVDPYAKFLYWVLPGGKALRYGIGVGRAGFAWSGDAIIRMKREWPIWRPPREMIARKPSLERYWVDGMEGGLRNPLGARALYLWQGRVDTLYRIHGTNRPNSIGKSVSSGCIRMWQQDVIDLYARVPMNTKVVVVGAPS